MPYHYSMDSFRKAMQVHKDSIDAKYTESNYKDEQLSDEEIRLKEKYSIILKTMPQDIRNYPLYAYIDAWIGTPYKPQSLDNLVCQGATCQCQFGNAPDKLKVLTQTKAFINEEEPQEKLVATTADVGATFEKNTFGLCQMQPLPGGGYKPCQAMVTQWSGAYENVTYEENNGHPLLEDSKATCPIGGKDCISIINHGQVAEITNRNLHSADPIKMDMINPFMDFGKFVNDMLTKPDITEAYFTDLQGNKIDLGEDEQDVYLVIEGENLSGLTMDFNLNNKDLDFKYKGNILENDTLKDYVFINDTKEQIPLTVIINTKK
ncbi:DUF4280 domain-containing protein [Capnocytophaga sp. oral taxon 338]|uniref:DUF4280 domain-containing protein n=1 Tax=Capnocytophaga sp. oral taxon 338 TaxID=710239 RepID=UPI0020A6D950|nr:DUF4280 domain-containing protein [Capnocytophaga sp. oral taxon 338]